MTRLLLAVLMLAGCSGKVNTVEVERIVYHSFVAKTDHGTRIIGELCRGSLLVERGDKLRRDLERVYAEVEFHTYGKMRFIRDMVKDALDRDDVRRAKLSTPAPDRREP